MDLKGIAGVIESNDNFAILPHVSADGDSIGSSLGLLLMLRKLGKKATVLLEEEPAEVFKFMPEFSNLKIYDESIGYTFDCVIALDTGDLKRLGNRLSVFESCAETANIDHHPTNTAFAKYNYTDAGASAVAEIMWDLSKLVGVEMDADIAACLYTSIMTDTGGFRYSNTSAKTHEIAAEMIKLGVKIDKISSSVFESNTVSRLKLVGLVLNTLEMYFDNRLALISVTREMLEKASATDEDAEGLVNYAKGIMGAEVGILIKEAKDGVRVNYRSKEYVDVAQIASTLGGGGHVRAAGCTLEMGINEAKAKILDIFKKVFVD